MLNLYYLILVHENPNQLARLIKSLITEYSFFFVHVDKKVALRPFLQVMDASQLARIEFLENRIKCKWGHISLVTATNLLLQKLHAKPQKKGYVILLSGKHYPIKSNDFIQNYLTASYGKNYLESAPVYTTNWPLKAINRIQDYYFFPTNNRKFITSVPVLGNIRAIFNLPGRKRQLLAFIQFFRCIKERNHPKGMIPYTGSQWWSLPIETSWLMWQFICAHPELLHFHRYSFAPDEMYFHTIVRALQSVEIQQNIVQNNLVYIDWKKHDYVRPAVLDGSYFTKLQKSTKLFARKFEPTQSGRLYDMIEKHCR